MFIAFALLAGALAILATPREEEPQIVVPMADVLVDFPGHSAAEVEQLVTTPLERLLWQIDGVEHVYSVSRSDRAMVTVRFFVGVDRERALIRLRDRIEANRDIVPPGVTGWVVKPVEIDDVPIVTLTLCSPAHDPFALRRLAEEMKARLDAVANISRSEIFGGLPREVLVTVDLEALAARGVTLAEVVAALRRDNQAVTAGAVAHGNRTARVQIGQALVAASAVAATVICEHAGRPVRVEDVARVEDGAAEPECYLHLGLGPAAKEARWLGPPLPLPAGERLPAVTIAFSKKKGTNAVAVAREIIAAADDLRRRLLPDGVHVLATRDYGAIADAKVQGLLRDMALGVIAVSFLVTLFMGWREGLVVGLAVPVSFALALFTNYAFGFTINRVTLFALILSLGLVVDDPIVNVDNIQRHIRLARQKPRAATLSAVAEVLPPVIMSTLTIIVSFLPLFFITGMMGPYMGPMAINVPLTVSFSTLCALTFVPWLCLQLLRNRPAAAADDITSPLVRRLYRAALEPFLARRAAFLLFGIIGLLFAGSLLIIILRAIPLKMLPFDNKNELQIVLNMPEGTALETTDRAVQEIETYLATVNEVADFQSYTGINSPIDFNGLVRHYGMRRLPHHADIRVNLADKARRRQQSHAIALRLRDPLTAIAQRHGAALQIVEVPPGPPVLSTIVVEIRGREDLAYEDLLAASRILQERMRAEDPKHIVQIDDMAEAPHARWIFQVDRDRASAHGLSVAEISEILRIALAGGGPGIVHEEGERNPLLTRVRLSFADRTAVERLGQIPLRRTAEHSLPLAEVGRFIQQEEEQPIYHKNLERVVFVTAECAGRPPGEIILGLWRRLSREPLPPGIRLEWAGEGEWEITVRVFRDLGLAFGVAMTGIYLLLVLQTSRLALPLLLMVAIPFTAIGIFPGFALLNLVAGKTVAGYADPVYFTATGMIGMIALGGIVVRNSIVLIEFIEAGVAGGMPLREAILESGAVRMRPIFLTAATTVMGAVPITFDPVFSGLAWALIFGLLASTVFTLLAVPAAYHLLARRANA